MFTEYLVFLLKACIKIVIWRFTRNDLERENLLLLRENQILKRRQKKVTLTSLDRHFYLAIARGSRKFLKRIIVIRPETVLSWHMRLVRKKWNFENQRVGRPPLTGEIRDLVIEMKKANPKWGCQRIMGELKKLNFKICKASVFKIINDYGFNPSPNEGLSWPGFIKNHGKRIFACDFFTVDTAFLKKFHVFFIIDIVTREIVNFGVRKNPNGDWLKNHLRSFFAFASNLPDILISDRDAIFIGWMKPFLKEGYGIQLRQIPPRMPIFNCYAERMVRTFREELTDRIIIFGENDLRLILKEYVEYYNSSRAHSALEFKPPRERLKSSREGTMEKHKILNGLITDFRRAG